MQGVLWQILKTEGLRATAFAHVRESRDILKLREVGLLPRGLGKRATGKRGRHPQRAPHGSLRRRDTATAGLRDRVSRGRSAIQTASHRAKRGLQNPASRFSSVRPTVAGDGVLTGPEMAILIVAWVPPITPLTRLAATPFLGIEMGLFVLPASSNVPAAVTPPTLTVAPLSTKPPDPLPIVPDTPITPTAEITGVPEPLTICPAMTVTPPTALMLPLISMLPLPDAKLWLPARKFPFVISEVDTVKAPTDTCDPEPNTTPFGLTRNTLPFEVSDPKIEEGAAVTTRFRIADEAEG